MLTQSLNAARAQADTAPQISSEEVGQEMDEDTLKVVANNTEQLKELEAQLASVLAYGGIQNTKAEQEAKQDFEKALMEA